MNPVVLSSNTDWYLFNFRLSLAKAIGDAGFRVQLASPAGPYVEELKAHDLQWHEVPMARRGLNPLNELGTLRSYLSLYREIGPSIVHHFTIKPVIYGSVAARIAGVPAVINSITGLGYVFSGRNRRFILLQWLLWPALRLALGHPNHRAIFQNQDDLDLYVSSRYVRRNVTTLIPGSGVDPSQFAPFPEPIGIPVVLLAARMLWDKGVGDLVEAARLLKARKVPARIVLAGGLDKGNPSAIPEGQLNQWQEEGIVEWWGHQEDMPSVYRLCHIAVLPSYHEGMPRTLVEAAAMARPIVASDLPGCRAIVKDGENGLLIPLGDPDSLSTALQKLIEAPELRKSMGENGRELVLSGFTDEIINHETIELYRSLLGHMKTSSTAISLGS
ncbi:MAG: glycosyltransferase family 4 protein [Anaerolineales bacterium]